MKISVISPVFPPYSGGIGNVAFKTAQEIQKYGFSVGVFTPNYNKSETIKEICGGLTVTRIKPMLKYGNAAFVPAMAGMIGSDEIMHLHFPFFGGAEVAWYLKRKKKIKMILHYHMDVVGQGALGIFFKLYKKILLPRIIKAADRIIVTSCDYIKNSDIRKYYFSQQAKFSEVPNGVDIKLFTPQEKDKELIRIHGLNGKKVILFVGALDRAHYFKGVDVLLRALAILPENYYLIIVGGGDMLSDYRLLAANIKVASRVLFAGKVSDQELQKYYNLADVVVLPSIDKSEAFGMVLIEAMSCAKPVIATNLPGVRSVVDDGVNGYLVESKNHIQLSEKIKLVLDNPGMAQMMGEQGRKKAVSCYDWSLIAKKIISIYNEVI